MLSFAWKIRDRSTWHVVGLTLLLALFMGVFFVVFRITYPVVQQADAVPQHLLVLDPADPGSLAVIHRAQDRSFALLSDSDSALPSESPLLAFHPTFDGHEIKLRALEPEPAAIRQPRLFTATSDVLPPVPRRATEAVTAPRAATLRAVVSPALAKRGPANVELSGINLTQPTRVQFRVAVGASGQIITALPLGNVEDPGVMQQLHAAVTTLRFTPSSVRRMEWGEVSFRWEAVSAP